MSGENFEPFFDWEAVTDEMAADLHAALVKQVRARQAFVEELSTKNASAFLKATHEVNQIGQAIEHTVWTLPAIIHEAGEKKIEVDEDDDQTVVQRCKRCGSILQMWHDHILIMTPSGLAPISEEDVPWWEPGTVVGKSSSETGIMNMYEVDDRELEKHEKICPDLAALSE